MPTFRLALQRAAVAPSQLAGAASANPLVDMALPQPCRQLDIDLPSDRIDVSKIDVCKNLNPGREKPKYSFALKRWFVALGLLLSAPAFANPVVWFLSGVTFTDGGTASGSFTYDADTLTLSTWSISVAGGNTATFPPITYAPANSTLGVGHSNPQPTFIFELSDGSQIVRFVDITPNSALTDAGGTVALNLATAGDGSGGVECFNCAPDREINAGSLTTTVYEPAPTLSLFGLVALILSLTGIGFALRRRAV